VSLNEANYLFQKNAKTFSLAAKLFQKAHRADITVFYAFCRTIDDIADLSRDKEAAKKKLYAILNNLESSLINDFPDMHALMNRKKISYYFLEELLNGLIEDLDPRAIATVDELLEYCKKVASTVGMIVCNIVGPIEEKALPHAIDLGIAMQLTNIARDVFEDANSAQVFLPIELFDPSYQQMDHQAFCKLLKEEFGSSWIQEARNKILDLADSFYKSGSQGYTYLPIRAKMAVAAAASMYREIGVECRKNPAIQRCHVSLLSKTFIGLKALSCLWLFSLKKSAPAKNQSFYQEFLSKYEKI